MIPKPLAALEHELRLAVRTRQFAEAGRLVIPYCRSAADHITSLPPGSVSGSEIATRVLEVLDWSNLMLLTARAAIADDLAPLPMISRYLTPPDGAPQMQVVA
jgi:hypothetical protein